jgi:hypothetical protein
MSRTGRSLLPCANTALPQAIDAATAMVLRTMAGFFMQNSSWIIELHTCAVEQGRRGRWAKLRSEKSRHE